MYFQRVLEKVIEENILLNLIYSNILFTAFQFYLVHLILLSLCHRMKTYCHQRRFNAIETSRTLLLTRINR